MNCTTLFPCFLIVLYYLHCRSAYSGLRISPGCIFRTFVHSVLWSHHKILEFCKDNIYRNGFFKICCIFKCYNLLCFLISVLPLQHCLLLLVINLLSVLSIFHWEKKTCPTTIRMLLLVLPTTNHGLRDNRLG